MSCWLAANQQHNILPRVSEMTEEVGYTMKVIPSTGRECMPAQHTYVCVCAMCIHAHVCVMILDQHNKGFVLMKCHVVTGLLSAQQNLHSVTTR